MAANLIKLGQKPSPSEPRPKHASYRALLISGRAVWQKKTRVYYQSAGDNPRTGSLQHLSKLDAHRTAVTLVAELKKARSDDEYNKLLMMFLKEITAAWPVENGQEQHVHECNQDAAVGERKPDGICSGCGFDWNPHQLTKECGCGIDITTTNEGTGLTFVVHRPYKKEAMVTVD
jgi:hypothetical protein